MTKNILITGGTGFLGSHLIHYLLSKNYKVILIKRTSSDTWRINDILKYIKSYNLDTDGIEIAFKEQHIDVVIHTACCYGRKKEKLSDIINANILFGIKVFENAILFNSDIFFNTDTFFNTATSLQKYLYQYCLSKRQFLEWLQQTNSNIQIINMKIQHMYGPNDDTTKFIPWIIEQIKQNEDHINLTEGKQKRDFVYVDDVVSAYTKVLEKRNSLPRFIELNVGTGKPVDLYQFVNEIAKQYKSIHTDNITKLNWGNIPYQEGEVMRVSSDISLLKLLDWHPAYSIQEGIKKTLFSSSNDH